MLGTLVAILIPTLTLVKTKLRQKSEERFEMVFENQVQLFVAERAQRLEGVSEAATELATSDAVKRSLAGDLDEAGKRAFSIEALAKRPTARKQGRSERPRAVSDEGSPANGVGQLLGLLPVLCTIDLQGQIEELTPKRTGRASARRTMELRHDGTLRQLPDVSEVEQQQVGYVIAAASERGGRLREVVATPVKQAGEVIGVFLMGIDAETELDHLASRLEKSTGETGSSTGFFAEDQIVQQKGLRDIDRQELSKLVAVEIDGETGMSELTLGGAPYRLAWQEMNPGSILPSAYQIAFFPMAEMRAEIRSLQIKLLLIGGGALLLAVIASYFISRGLAKPVKVLEEATRRIGDGDFSARVDVTSNDELGRLGSSFNEMAEGLALKERYREVLSKVSDAAVAQSLVEGELELGGETRFLTVMFCDIRSFTDLTEEMNPQEVISLLNEHMTAMTELVYAHKGVVDKFVGDEIMAVFGAPKEYGDDPANAVRCALAMIAKRAELNAGLEKPFEVGIGVASGEMMAGCMGSVNRLNYTVIGEPVNLAARLAGRAAPGEILAAVTEGIAVGEHLKLELKGFRGRVSAVRVKSVAEKASDVVG
ncbi:MAG: class 3 adenylate cyclase [Pseudoalteromonas tetraodonis]|jgi:class 3 adenylate cyclase